MKKFFIVFLSFFMIMTICCVPVFAAESSESSSKPLILTTSDTLPSFPIIDDLNAHASYCYCMDGDYRYGVKCNFTDGFNYVVCENSSFYNGVSLIVFPSFLTPHSTNITTPFHVSSVSYNSYDDGNFSSHRGVFATGICNGKNSCAQGLVYKLIDNKWVYDNTTNTKTAESYFNADGSSIKFNSVDVSVGGKNFQQIPLVSSTQLAGLSGQQVTAGVMGEIIQVLPVMVAALILLIALRKGYSFLSGILRAA